MSFNCITTREPLHMLTTSGSEWQCCPPIYSILIKKHLTERHLVDTFKSTKSMGSWLGRRNLCRSNRFRPNEVLPLVLQMLKNLREMDKKMKFFWFFGQRKNQRLVIWSTCCFITLLFLELAVYLTGVSLARNFASQQFHFLEVSLASSFTG